MMKRQDYRFFDRLRVRFSEVDSQGVVFNGHYLNYFDQAVSGYWRALALPYAESVPQFGGEFFMRKSTVEYFSRLVAKRCLTWPSGPASSAPAP